MKKLHLLEPKLITKFMNRGAGEAVSYLEISEEIILGTLEEDVQFGAVQFQDCLNQVKRGMSRVVVVRADNKESALMAVNYMAGICNERGVWGKSEDGYECASEDADYSFANEDVQGLEDFCRNMYEEEEDEDEISGFDSGNVFSDLENLEDLEEEEFDIWEESPFRVPVVNVCDIDREKRSAFDDFFESNHTTAGILNVGNSDPYWLRCTRESICVVVDRINDFWPGRFSALSHTLKRFQGNKHLYVLYIAPFSNREEEKSEYGFESGWSEQDLLQYVLENSADVVTVRASEDELKKYHFLQFDNWARELNIPLAMDFPRKEIVDAILQIRNMEKSSLIKSILKYAKKEHRGKSNALYSEEDFAFLNKFSLLGLNCRDERTYSEKLEQELVGMDQVKEQLKNIMQIMRFNKYREAHGMGRGNFHNMHLLIGAPGTAKTTVAKLLGNMMCEEHLLPGNRFASINGAELKGMYVGHSAPKTKKLFNDHDIILIDEAYSLVTETDCQDSFSQEAIAQLIIEIEEHATDKLVMFAGYGGAMLQEKDNRMKAFLDANPGLKSRINSTIYFDSYTPHQMVEILHLQAQMQKFTVSREADGEVYSYFEERVLDPDFGNGREARSLLENAMVYTAARVMELPESKKTPTSMSEITAEDIVQAIARMKSNLMMQRGRERRNIGFY